MPASAYDQALFRVNFPHVISYVESSNETDPAYAEALARDGVLETREVVDIESAITAAAVVFPDEPAREWEATWIPNGDYSVTTNPENPTLVQSFEFRIHLVREGALAGKRIIKIKRFGSTIYSGFAFLTRSGGFRIWSRFASGDLDTYSLAARALLADLNSRQASHQDCSVVNNLFRHEQTQAANPVFSVDGMVTALHITYRVRHVRCQHCNAVAHAGGLWALCGDHSVVPPRPNLPDPALERLLAEEEEIERRNRRNPARRRPTRRPAEAPVDPAAVPMCRITGKHVL